MTRKKVTMLPQHILVTGGAGFIGSHTVNLLVQQGFIVTVLDNLSSGQLSNLDLHHPNIDFIEGDILEYPLVEKLVASADAVLHLAAIASVPFSIENPIYSFQVNVQGLLHVLCAIQQAQRPIRLVYASSAAVYGNTQALPCQEAMRGTPLSPYALHKMNNEDDASLFTRLHAISSLALRYFNVYGPGQDPTSPYSGVISRFMGAYQRRETLTIFGNGEQSRDFIHVHDVARANLLALNNSYCGTLNVATGKPQTLLQLIHYIQAAGSYPATVLHAPAREGDIQASYAATRLATEHLNFTYTIELADGIKQMSAGLNF
jgi:UDP-glucose 4-epimerase